MDIVDNANVAQEIVDKQYPHLREVCIRFGLFQRLDYMLHIPVMQMNSNNEFYKYLELIVICILSMIVCMAAGGILETFAVIGIFVLF